MTHLKKILEERGITQTELANQVGVTQPHISFICQGNNKPGLDTLIKIAAFLNMSLDQIIRGQ